MADVIPFAYQDTPRCLGCAERIENLAEAVFAASCGHETCPSDVWHYHHYMQARDAVKRHAGDPVSMAIALQNVIDSMRER